MIKAYRRTSFRYDFIRENHEKEINFSFKFVSQEGKDKKKPHFKGLNLHFELNTILNKRDIDLYHYEIWKKDGDNLVFVDDVFLSLDKFREYFFADERSTNFKIINELIIPTIIKNDN